VKLLQNSLTQFFGAAKILKIKLSSCAVLDYSRRECECVAVEARRPAQGRSEHGDVAARGGVRMVRSAAHGAAGNGSHAQRLLDCRALLRSQFVDIERSQWRLEQWHLWGANVVDGLLETRWNLHLRRKVCLDQPEGVAGRRHVLLLPRARRFDFGVRRLEIRGQVMAPLSHGR